MHYMIVVSLEMSDDPKKLFSNIYPIVFLLDWQKFVIFASEYELSITIKFFEL